MNKALVSIIVIIVINFILPPTFALDSTPSATVKEKLDALKAEIASKAAKLKSEINRKLTNKAYIGIIKSKSDASITLGSKVGTKMVSVNQDTVYEDKNPVKKGTKKVASGILTIKEESSIAALGDVDDTGVLHAKKIVILQPPASNLQPPVYFWGQIISESDEIVSIKTKDSAIKTVSMSEIKLKFKTDDFVIITGTLGKNDILEAKFLYVIPKGPLLKSKTATPSATPKLAPKTTPKPTTKP
ncbi:hypothetical protein A3F00_01905 [Candidatus Daviesbacteria bacterium RIFCSPHIGHO2_12_FULL_37_11]|uniref:DUF5666 domain-containing protein n=1 Tax=Candidatus Daviesbacteria bacterium RIFCSPHIGHO2_12_FULL_37_11 TaxID=1797777 RepID=A0A1F5KDC1_9BACT|nr:MAG: hypothetical protein A2111_03195 [Candidatus Daviesbacteria bacterium GWA1_38_6]OGE17644.1 MAG: hypothetical protein A2769_04000 [Candidatus Daviesbacteria bacterium RIFCSPHIGHO2_01_FULL_37_27]OGE38942.1 MAG: hypothetical protein A3F00_01905 [Candidatus Daviesbacteria bacterium RIFCSPHIGHO2_12_FULL_37_11]OGE46155.1 MAG: hypothetical protein A3B39_02045 [Candidatus Daviesbacteria bacterium RIFCSPLOWO2_01_FULL_37_10]